jgi:hypothetical protein
MGLSRMPIARTRRVTIVPDTIPITDQIAWSLVPRECLADLASSSGFMAAISQCRYRRFPCAR